MNIWPLYNVATQNKAGETNSSTEFLNQVTVKSIQNSAGLTKYFYNIFF